MDIDLTTMMYLALGAFLVLNLLVGLGQGKAKNIESWALANRSIGTGALIITITATVVGAKYVTGKILNIQYYGGIITSCYQVAGYVSMALLLGIYVYPKMLRFKNCYTMGDIMGRTYGRSAQWLTGGISVIFSVVFVISQLALLGNLAAYLHIDRKAIILVMGIIITLYTYLGGMKSVSATDVLQFLLVFGGFALLAKNVLDLKLLEGGKKAIGSLESLFHIASRDYPEKMTIFNHPTLPWLGMSSVGFFYATMLLTPPVVQRVLVARDPNQAKRAFIGFAVFQTMLFFLITIVGLGLLLAHGSNQIPVKEIFDLMAKYLLHDYNWGRVLLLWMLLSVVMSTADSFLNTAVVIAVRDIIRHFVPEEKFDEMRWIGYASLFLGIFCTLLALPLPVELCGEWNNVAIEIAGVVLVPFIATVIGLKGDRKAFLASVVTFLLVGGILAYLAYIDYFGVELACFRFRRQRAYPFALLASGVAFLIAHCSTYGRLMWEPVDKEVIAYRRIAGKEEKFRVLFQRPLKWAKDRMIRYGSQPALLGFFLVISYVLPIATIPQIPNEYDIPFFVVRLIAITFCLGLVLHKLWQEPFKRYFPLYWFVSLVVCLPFFHTVLLCYNPTNTIVVVQFVLSIILLHLLVDWRTYCLLTIVGSGSGYLFYRWTAFAGACLSFNPMWQIIVGILYALSIGFLFASRKEQVNTNRVYRNKVWAGAFGHDLANIMQGMYWEILDEGNKESLRHLLKNMPAKEGKDAFVLSGKTYQNLVTFNEKMSIYLREAIKQADAFKKLVQYDYIVNKDILVRDIGEIVTKSYQLLSTEDQKAIEVVKSPSFSVMVYPTLMHNVITNLVKNAFEHGGAKKVSISWDKEARTLSITDDGRGISASVEPYIFDMDYSTNNSSGIGLSFVQHVLKVMEASIAFSTSSKGTTFSIKFPLA